jgi:C4-dicarboxylate-specific signal transduction histidine kinase
LKNVIVDFELTSVASDVFGNRLQLQQLVINLMINAMQALADHGTDVRKIIIHTDRTAFDQVRCTVEDNGTGIDPCHFLHLFEHLLTTKKAGMGMGLIISRFIVEAHGGSICAENNSSSTVYGFPSRCPQ